MIRFTSEERHRQYTDLLQEQMRNRTQKVTLAPSKNPSNTVRNHAFKKKTERLSMNHLDQIIFLDLDKQIVKLEPKLTVRKATKLLLRHQMMLPVVPEFSSITVGGAIMGASLESSSHRFGQFNDLCIEYELLLANGSLIIASAQENSDLFYALPGSYGSLALLTAVTMKVHKAKKYVHLTYKRYWDAPHLLHDLRSTFPHDFVEAMLFSKSWGVSVMGNLIDHPKDLPIHKQSLPYKKWYYQHILEKTEKRGLYEEVIPLQDYLFRLDRGAFWMGRFVGHGSLILKILFNHQLSTVARKIKERAKQLSSLQGPALWFRLLFDRFLTSTSLYRFWHRVPTEVTSSLFFVQDFYTPISKVEEMLQCCIDSTQIYPIWLCPIKNNKQGQFLSPHYCEERMINIGLYGLPKGEVPLPLLTEKLEKELYKVGGKKMLYSYTYYEKELFEKIYDGKSYQRIREKYGANEGFPSLYEKVKMY